MKKSDIVKFNRDNMLYDTLLTLEFSRQLIEQNINDTKIELKEMQRIKRAIEKRLLKGKEWYKEKHGMEPRLKV